MIDYTSLKIVRVLEFAWLYYPNGLTTPFGISKGYFTYDAVDNKLLIIEDGKSQRPKVNLANVTIEDIYLSEAEITFTTNFANFSNILTSKGCPLAVDQIQVLSGGISEAPIDGIEYVRKDATWVANTGGSTINPDVIVLTFASNPLTVPDSAKIWDVVNLNNLSKIITVTINSPTTISIDNTEVDDKIKILTY